LSLLVGLAACGLDPEDTLKAETTCGNGKIDIGEGCDGDKFRVTICHAGELICKSDCTMDKSACTQWCGDDELNGPEECDGTAVKVACLEGTQKCNPDCTIDRSGCKAWCGDGKILPGKEQCDGLLMPKNVCHNGKAVCSADCRLDFHGCEEFCGDELLNGNEQCDRVEFYYRCHDTSGVLVCREDCTIDPGTCKQWCGDGVLNHVDEDCDGPTFRMAKPCAAAKCKVDCTVDSSGCS